MNTPKNKKALFEQLQENRRSVIYWVKAVHVFNSPLDEGKYEEKLTQAMAKMSSTRDKLTKHNLSSNGDLFGILEELQTPITIFDSVIYGDLYAAQKFLEQGVDPNLTEDQDRITLLHFAVQRQDEKMIDLLLTAGADPSKKNISGKTPIDLAATYGEKGNKIKEKLMQYSVQSKRDKKKH